MNNIYMLNEGILESIKNSGLSILKTIGGWGLKHPNLYATIGGLLAGGESYYLWNNSPLKSMIQGLISGGGIRLITYLINSGMDREEAELLAKKVENKINEEKKKNQLKLPMATKIQNDYMDMCKNHNVDEYKINLIENGSLITNRSRALVIIGKITDNVSDEYLSNLINNNIISKYIIFIGKNNNKIATELMNNYGRNFDIAVRTYSQKAKRYRTIDPKFCKSIPEDEIPIIMFLINSGKDWHYNNDFDKLTDSSILLSNIEETFK